VGYEDKTDEEGERLIVMVGVGLGYIVTDAIWVVVMIVVVRVMVGVMVGVGLGYIVTDAIWVVVMIVVDLLDVRLDVRLGEWRRWQSEGEGRAAWQGDCHRAAGYGSGNTTRDKTLNHDFLHTRAQQIGRLKLNLTWTLSPAREGPANSGEAAPLPHADARSKMSEWNGDGRGDQRNGSAPQSLAPAADSALSPAA
jgi:hypothetical protein